MSLDPQLNKISAIKKKLENLIWQAVSEEGVEDQNKVDQFIVLLNDSDFLMSQYYEENAADLLNQCINSGAARIASVLIDAGALRLNGTSALSKVAIMGHVEIYQKIEETINDNPHKYPEIYDDLQKGTDFHMYLINAIRCGEIPFINMLLEKYHAFYYQHDNKANSPINILFEMGGYNLDYADFSQIYQTMLSKGYKDVDFEVSSEELIPMIKSIIQWKDEGHLIQLLQQGKDIAFVDKDYHSPQELIASGISIHNVAMGLLNNELNEDNINTDDINQKLSHIISTVLAPDGKEIPEKVEEFIKLLHTGHDCFMQDYRKYNEFSARLLNHCLIIGATGIAHALIDADAYLIFQNVNLLENAVEMGKIEIYHKIEEKIKSSPEKYPKLYKDIAEGTFLHKYLSRAISYGDIPMIKMLLEKYSDFYHKNDAKEQSPVNMLYEKGKNKFDKNSFLEIYESMMKLGYQDIHFDGKGKNIEAMFEAMIKWRDIGHIMHFLHQGKDISYVDKNDQTPQELINQGESIEQVANRLLNNEFVYDKFKMKKLDEHSLSPNDTSYSNIAIAKLSAIRKNELKNQLTALLPTIELGKTKLDHETERQIYEKVMTFLNKEGDLFLNIDRVEAAIQLLRMFRNPECLDQGQHNLCGVSTFIQILVDNHPLEFLDEMITFCESGQTQNPYFVSMTEKIKNDNNIFHAFIKAYKHTHSAYGYHQIHPVVEAMLGGTKSKSLAGWMQAVGYENIVDTWEVVDAKGKEISLIHQGILGGLYSMQYHKAFSKKEDRFAELLTAFAEQKAIMLNIGPSLAKDYKGYMVSDLRDQEESREKSLLLGLVYTHWVNLKEIHYDKDTNEVHLKYFTKGKCYDYTISEVKFLAEFHGMVAGNPPAVLNAADKINRSKME